MRAVTLIGFGEAGRAFTRGWRSEGHFPILSYDIKAQMSAEREEMISAWAGSEVSGHASLAPVLADAAIVLCLVSADQARAAAEAAAPHLRAGALWLDGNSCSPGTKRGSAEVINAAGGRYVDMAIMAPVEQRLHRTPLLLSGPDAKEAKQDLVARGMHAEIAGDRVGDASSIKMIRSVMIKGFEALTAECLLAARRAGVEAAVLDSLKASDPGLGWDRRAPYNLERMRVHGLRRAAEMGEVAATLDELGIPSRLARASLAWQQQLAGIAAAGDGLAEQLDAILARIGGDCDDAGPPAASSTGGP